MSSLLCGKCQAHVTRDSTEHELSLEVNTDRITGNRTPTSFAALGCLLDTLSTIRRCTIRWNSSTNHGSFITTSMISCFTKTNSPKKTASGSNDGHVHSEFEKRKAHTKDEHREHEDQYDEYHACHHSFNLFSSNQGGVEDDDAQDHGWKQESNDDDCQELVKRLMEKNERLKEEAVTKTEVLMSLSDRMAPSRIGFGGSTRVGGHHKRCW